MLKELRLGKRALRVLAELGLETVEELKALIAAKGPSALEGLQGILDFIIWLCSMIPTTSSFQPEPKQ